MENNQQEQGNRQKQARNVRRFMIVLLATSLMIFFSRIYLEHYFEKDVPVEQEQAEDNQKESTVSTVNPSELTVRSVNNPNYELTVIENKEREEKSKKDNGEIILLGEEDITLKGISGNKDIYFHLPPGNRGDKSYLELTISSSELISPKFSSLTVSLNNTPLKSIKLEKEMEFYTVQIPLKKSLFIEGFNHISIRSNTLINNDLCLDQNDPGNWIILHNTSYAFIDKGNALLTKDLLKQFPYPFVVFGGQEEIFTSIVIPDNSNGSMIKSAMELAQYLSSETQKKQKVNVKFESEWVPAKEENHIIAMGPLSSWQGEVKARVSTIKETLGENELYLHNIIEKTGSERSRQILFVTANTTDTIVEKGFILTNKSLTSQLTGNSIKIAQTPLLRNEEVQTNTSLKPIEESIILDESALKSQKLFVNLPTYWTIEGKGTMNLKFQASLLLEQLVDEKTKDKLGLTVYINDKPYTIPLASLLKNMKTNQTLEYKIPITEDLFQGRSYLSMEFEFNYPTEQTGCTQRTKSGNWLVILQESELTVPYSIVQSQTFQKWPSVLLGENGFDRIAFILPEKVPVNGLDQLSTLMNHLVNFQMDIKEYVIIRHNEELTEEILKDYHLIDFGGLDEHISSEQLPLIPKGDNQVWDLSKYGFINETVRYVSWIQPSFWNEERVVVFLRALDKNLRDPFFHREFLKYLQTEVKTEKPVIIVLNKANQAFSFEAGAENVSSDFQETEQPRNRNSMYFILFGSIFIAGIGVFLYLLKRRKRN